MPLPSSGDVQDAAVLPDAAGPARVGTGQAGDGQRLARGDGERDAASGVDGDVQDAVRDQPEVVRSDRADFGVATGGADAGDEAIRVLGDQVGVVGAARLGMYRGRPARRLRQQRGFRLRGYP